MIAFFRDLFDTSGFPARWHCGQWADAHGWLHILSDIAIFGAYAAIPLALLYFIRRRKDVPFLPILWLFGAFILSCGLTHLIEATIFWHPWYRLSGLMKAVTAVVSWITVIALLKFIPSALALPGLEKVNRRLSKEIAERQKAEETLQVSEERLKLAAEAGGVGIWDWNLVNNTLVWDDAMFALYGARREDFSGAYAAWAARLHPEDRAASEAASQDAVAGRKDYPIEFRVIWPDGSVHHLEAHGRVFHDEAGQPVRMIGTNVDITARKQAEESRARLAAIVESSHDALFGEDLDGIITSWNPGAEQIFGYRAEEIVGTSVVRLIPANRQAAEHELQRQIVAGELGGTFETIRLTKEGREFPASVTVAPMKDAAGKVIGTSRVLRNITERKRAEEAVLAAGERFRFMAESMPQKICTATPAGDIDYFNQRWTEFTGLTYQQLKDRGWKEFVHPDDLEENIRRWQHCLETGEPFELEHRFRRHDGEYRWHLSRAHAMRDAQGEITIWIGSNTDIDDMMRAQEELMEAEQQLAHRAVQLEALVAERTVKLSSANAQLLVEAEERKRLEAEIAYAVENERARLGQELHDGLVQEMVGVGMLLHVLERQMKKPAPEFSTEVGRLGMMIEKAQENARDLAKNFYPVELEQYGLHVALEGLAQRAQAQHGIRCTVETDEHPTTELRGARAVQLFRIAQEAVQNAAKHSKASHIVISLRQENGAWLLTVKDDGIGLPANAQPTKGMGQRILQYRARIIQGTLTVRNNPDRGVTVACSAPSTAPGEPDTEEQLALSL